MTGTKRSFASDMRGFPCIALETVTSTNAEARARVRQVSAPTWVVARRQTAGRGRAARVWHSEAGNFYGTLILPDAGIPGSASLRSFVAALAVRDALSRHAPPGCVFRLKWPNDVLAHGRKISGILLETEGPSLLIGIGVNLIVAPNLSEGVGNSVRVEGYGYLERRGRELQPVDLRSVSGVTVTPGQFLCTLAPAVDAWEKRLRSEGFSPIRDAWLEAAEGIGARVAVRTGTRETTGVFESIDHTGAMMLATSEGHEVVTAADIHLLATDTTHAACD